MSVDPETQLSFDLSPKIVRAQRSLTVRQKLSFVEFEQAVETLVAADGASPWHVGDLLSYGEKTLGEKYADAVSVELADVTGVTIETIMQYQWVADRVPKERRVALSWSHHRCVAGLDGQTQSQLLKQAKEENWTKQRLAAHVKKLTDDVKVDKANADGVKIVFEYRLIVQCDTPVQRDELRMELMGRGFGVTMKDDEKKVATEPKTSKKTKSAKTPEPGDRAPLGEH